MAFGTNKVTRGPTKKPVSEREFLTPGEKFGDYQVMQCISYGLLGGLYRMQHIREFDEVVFAVFPKRLTTEVSFETRIKEGVTKLQELKHPNILHTVKFRNINEHMCIMMDDIEGVNLNDYLGTFVEQKQNESASTVLADHEESFLIKEEALIQEREFGLPVVVVKDVLNQTIEALKYAHDLGIYHYTLNPNNIILTNDGKVKLFGFHLVDIMGVELVSKLMGRSLPPLVFGPKKLTVNVAKAIAPEIKNGEVFQARTDFHSLGFTSYFLLSGHMPDKEDYRRPSTFSASIPDGWDTLIGRCLEDQADKRYPSIEAVNKDLQKVDKLQTKVGTPAVEGAMAKQLKKIPLPKTIERRFSSRILKAIRLGILGAFGIVVLAISSWSYIELMEEEETTETKGVREVNRPGVVPNVVLLVEPKGTRLRMMLKGKQVAKFTNPEGVYKLQVEAGSYDIILEKPDYITQRKTGQTLGIRSYEPPKFKLREAWANLEFKGDPGATVTSTRQKPGRDDEEILGIIPESGVLEVKERLYWDTYKFVVSKENYKEVVHDKVELKDSGLVAIESVLEPVPGNLKVVTTPPGATLTYNGLEVGVTPFEIEDIEIGELLNFRVELADHRSKEVTTTVEPGENGILDFGTMQLRTGTLEPEIWFGGDLASKKMLAETDFFMANKRYRIKDRLELPMGTYPVKISHKDYYPWEDSVTILDGGELKILAKLKPREGKLRIEIDPKYEIQLVANNRLKETVKGQKRLYEFEAGKEFKLLLSVLDHLSTRWEIRLKPNETKIWKVDPKPIPGPKIGETWRVPYVGSELLWVKPGVVKMGSPMKEESRRPNEGPSTSVRISEGFWMAKHEVTQLHYKRVMRENPSEFIRSGDKSHPVEQVSWFDAASFCARITKRERSAGRLPEGYVYRLPTEAEWEFVARAGTATPFNFGNNADASLGNFMGEYPRAHEGQVPITSEYGTYPVGKYEPNTWGFYDMHGNVREWCYDLFNARLPGGNHVDWAGPKDGEERVNRGGGWGDSAHRCRVSAREGYKPSTKSNLLGFRYVMAKEIKSSGN